MYYHLKTNSININSNKQLKKKNSTKSVPYLITHFELIVVFVVADAMVTAVLKFEFFFLRKFHFYTQCMCNINLKIDFFLSLCNL